MSWSCVRFN